jgi:SAM-dependent methyltransferase
MSYQYDSAFFDFVDASSGKSASRFLERVVGSVLEGSSAGSVLDVGCGRGVWLAVWKGIGAHRVQGVDGEYVDRSTLLISPLEFCAKNIAGHFDLGEKFDLVQCLEVAEHVPDVHAETLVDNLARHGDLILFSAAIPGQGGEFHVNERPYSYWREKFAARGYALYDAIRPCVAELDDVEPWYRYNAFVYANERGATRLTSIASARHVPAGRPVRDISPIWWRLRCAALSVLPLSLTSALARAKHRAANLLR